MTCSPAQLAANRLNALKSTGPRTEQGKKASRANAVKHGLTGAGVALPTEDAEAVAGRFRRLRDELSPSSELAEVLVERVAMLSVRLGRCARLDTAALSDRVLTAGPAFDEARRAEADRLVQTLGAHPATNRRLLLGSPEGVDALIREWRRLAEAIEGRGGRWEYDSYLQADWLNGHNSVVTSDYMALTFAMNGRFEKLAPEEGAGLAPGPRAMWARSQIIERIAGEIAALEAHRATLDTAAIEARRALAADLALFDPSKEATLARKYEAAAERALFRTLRELRQVEAESTGRAEEPEPDAEIEPEPGPSGSFFSPESPDPDRPDPARPGTPPSLEITPDDRPEAGPA